MELEIVKNMQQRLGLLLFLSLLFFACEPDGNKGSASKKPAAKKIDVKVPVFNENTAYDYIAKQVAFGPRVPGSDAHKECADWMEAELTGIADKVEVQKGSGTIPGTDKVVPIYNIIASFNPEKNKRVLLCAHWDTRPWADEDSERQDEPIDGANDGGSGVGVLLEIAQRLKADRVDYGVDIVLFDLEDAGKPGITDSYCKGSQYWGKKALESGYKANYGILLDMVGAENALFYQEGLSRQIAQPILDKVWSAANDAGYSSYFEHKAVNPVTDDHKYVHYYTRIPIIDIIQFDNFTQFGDYWHTHKDNMDVISKRTLKAVGQTVLQVLYSENTST